MDRSKDRIDLKADDRWADDSVWKLHVLPPGTSNKPRY